LIDTHITHMKKVITGKFSNSDQIVGSGRMELFRNTQDLTRAISNLFNSTVMGQRFQTVWEAYIDNMQIYIDAVFNDKEMLNDFGDDKSYRDSRNTMRKLRKNSGDIIGFFAHYLNNRDTFKTHWTLFMQRLKDSVMDGARVSYRKGSKAQFRKGVRDSRVHGKAFGEIINRFR